jgi:hypothetical protein
VCIVCDRAESREDAATIGGVGPVAQSGSAPPWHGGGRQFESVQVHFLGHGLGRLWSSCGSVLAGLVAGEGSYSIARRRAAFADGTPRLRFVFSLGMARRDRPLLEALQRFLGVGAIYDLSARKPHRQPESGLWVSDRRSHHQSVIPFSDRFLLPQTAKWRQYVAWREALLRYEAEHPPRAAGVCRVEGCGRPIRGQGLCRSHYYRATGH